MSLSHIFYRLVDDITIPGKSFQAFIKNGDLYFVTEIKVYRDSKIYCWEMLDFDGFKEKIDRGWVKTSLPEGARVSMMCGNLSFTVDSLKERLRQRVNAVVEEQEFIKEVEDEIRRLNGQLTTTEICRQALLEYNNEPNQHNRDCLSKAYDAVPKHCRIYLGGMDDKDSEYRSILDRWED
jgi:hypothetical protein